MRKLALILAGALLLRSPFQAARAPPHRSSTSTLNPRRRSQKNSAASRAQPPSTPSTTSSSMPMAPTVTPSGSGRCPQRPRAGGR